MRYSAVRYIYLSWDGMEKQVLLRSRMVLLRNGVGMEGKEKQTENE